VIGGLGIAPPGAPTFVCLFVLKQCGRDNCKLQKQDLDNIHLINASHLSVDTFQNNYVNL
jgi:hypothetical protein